MLRYVDHAIIAVADLDGAARDYEQLLGLTVSAGGSHPGAGTQNRVIVLDPAYIELIARLPGASLTEQSPVTPMFARAPGPIGFALASDDIDADLAAMRARGVPVSGPHVGRLEGPRGTGRGWRTARPGEDARLGGAPWRLPFLIQHHSTGQERLRRLTAPDGPRPHPLGARRLDHVTVAVHDLAAGLRAYTLVYGLEPDDEAEDPMLRARTTRLPLPQGAIVLAAPLEGDGPLARGLAAQGEGLFSIAIAVDDLPGAVHDLRGRGVGVRVEEPDGVLVAARPAPAPAPGASLELVRS